MSINITDYSIRLLARCDSFHDFCQGGRNKNEKESPELCKQVNGRVEGALDLVKDLKYESLKDLHDYFIKSSSLMFTPDEQIELTKTFDKINKNIKPSKQSFLPSFVDVGNYIDIYVPKQSNQRIIKDNDYIGLTVILVDFDPLKNYITVTCTSQSLKQIKKILFFDRYKLDIVEGWKHSSERWERCEESLSKIDIIIQHCNSIFKNTIYLMDETRTIQNLNGFRMTIFHVSLQNIVLQYTCNDKVFYVNSDFYNDYGINGWSFNDNWYIYCKQNIYLNYFNQYGVQINLRLEDKSEVKISKVDMNQDISLFLFDYKCILKKDYDNNLPGWYISQFIEDSTQGAEFHDLSPGSIISIVYIVYNPIDNDYNISIKTAIVLDIYGKEFDITDGKIYYDTKLLVDDGEIEENFRLYEDYYDNFCESGWTFKTLHHMQNFLSETNIKSSTWYDAIAKLSELCKNANDLVTYKNMFKIYGEKVTGKSILYSECTFESKQTIQKNVKYFYLYTTSSCYRLDYAVYNLEAVVFFIPFKNQTDKHLIVKNFFEPFRNPTYNDPYYPNKRSQLYKQFRKELQTNDKFDKIFDSHNKSFDSMLKMYLKHISYPFDIFECATVKNPTNSRLISIIHMFMYNYDTNVENAWAFENESFSSKQFHGVSSSYNNKVIHYISKLNPELFGAINEYNASRNTPIDHPFANPKSLQIFIERNQSNTKFCDDNTIATVIDKIEEHFGLTTKPNIIFDCECKFLATKTNDICSITKLWDSRNDNCIVIPSDIYPQVGQPESFENIFFVYEKASTIAFDSLLKREYIFKNSPRRDLTYTLSGKDDPYYLNPSSRATTNTPWMFKTVDLLRKGILGLVRDKTCIPGGKLATDHELINVNLSLDVKRSGDGCMIHRAKSKDYIFATIDQLAFLEAKLKGVKCILISFSSNNSICKLQLYNPSISMTQPISSLSQRTSTLKVKTKPNKTTSVHAVRTPVKIVQFQISSLNISKMSLDESSIKQYEKQKQAISIWQWGSYFFNFASCNNGEDNTPKSAKRKIADMAVSLQKKKRQRGGSIIPLENFVVYQLFHNADMYDDDEYVLRITEYIISNKENIKSYENARLQTKSQSYLNFLNDPMWNTFIVLYQVFNNEKNTDFTFEALKEKIHDIDDVLNADDDMIKHICAVYFLSRPTIIAPLITQYFGNWELFYTYMYNSKLGLQYEQMNQDISESSTSLVRLANNNLGLSQSFAIPLISRKQFDQRSTLLKPKPNLNTRGGYYKNKKTQKRLIRRMLRKIKRL